jgi:phosphopantetheinyl transferase
VLILQLGKITAIFSYMPLIYQHQINQTSQLGVWHIAEGEPFFLQKVPLQRSITHPHKRLQHLAGRYLLTELVPDFPLDLIQVADTRKPFLANEAWHFSLSHCGDYAAAIVSPAQRVGVDVELVSEKVARVQGKFLTAEELAMLNDEFGMTNERIQLTVDRGQLTGGKIPLTVDSGQLTGGREPSNNFQLSTFNFQLLTACWSIKEALFKWKGSGEMDFRQHLRIEQLHIKDNEGVAHCRILKDGDIELKVYCLLFGGVCLSWVCS